MKLEFQKSLWSDKARIFIHLYMHNKYSDMHFNNDEYKGTLLVF